MLHQANWFLLDKPVDINLAGFVFFSTLSSYSFHWYFTSQSVIPSPRIQWLKDNRPIHVALFTIGISGALYFFYFLSSWWLWLLPAVIATFLYSAPKVPNRYLQQLRKVAFGKTIFLALVWMYVTTILPVVVSGTKWNNEFLFFAVSRLSLIYSIAILFDYRDREDDKLAGIKSLITYLSEKNITYLFSLTLVVFAVSTVWLLTYEHSIINIIILLIPGIFVAALFNYARKNFSDILYYFVLDGLLALSPVLMLIARI